ncbi:hypothetical protein AU510_07710 [Lonsdalea britannica]|uniref:DUF6694 family lipoprotein n=1 Tax=Lonsdalea britannica TaxID=1082704 RepID=UPI000A1F44B8|nr:DUF6694 family lipoprotein [Lonsdalea britannica]OSN06401.1 hypothetical protein AU510_07710 [Lonsdalea britannica]
MKKIGIVIVIALVLSGCDKPKIDTSSEATAKSSVKKVRESLPEDKRAAYDDALEVVAFSNVSRKDLMKAKMANDMSTVQEKMMSNLSGKTGEEILSYADKLRKEKAEKEKEQAIQEIQELEEKQKKAELNLDKKKELVVSRSRFYFKKTEYGKDQPIIELTMENNTGKAVSRAEFKGVIASPGRQVPWFTDTFRSTIPGGLEPGEKADLTLPQNPYLKWGDVDLPSDAVFTVTVVSIDDAQGKPIFSDEGFSDEDANRLATLKAKYSDNNK